MLTVINIIIIICTKDDKYCEISKEGENTYKAMKGSM